MPNQTSIMQDSPIEYRRVGIMLHLCIGVIVGGVSAAYCFALGNSLMAAVGIFYIVSGLVSVAALLVHALVEEIGDRLHEKPKQTVVLPK